MLWERLSKAFLKSTNIAPTVKLLSSSIFHLFVNDKSRDGAVVRALASDQCVLGSIPQPGIMWVEFIVGSLPWSKRFFSGYCGFPLSSKNNISKFQSDLDYCQALYHEPLARLIAQTLPVFDIKLHLHLHFYLHSYEGFNILLPKSQPSEDARLARQQHYRAMRKYGKKLECL